MGQDPSAPDASGTKRPLIVLVEDEALIRTLVGKILGKEGYRTEIFASAFDGLAWMHAHPDPIDLLITDVNMAGMSGKAFGDAVCRHWPDTKILYISGYSPYPHELMNGCANREGNFLRKPFTPGSLMGKVREILGQERLQAR